MPGALGLRVAVLAAALVAVAIFAAVSGWSTLTIVLVMAGAFALTSAIEVLASWGEDSDKAQQEPAPTPEPAEEIPQHVRVLGREPAPAPAPVEPEPEPQPEPVWAAIPAPLVAVPSPPEPEQIDLERVPEPVREPEPVVVPLAAHDTRPREWNLWDLERATRERSGEDPVRDEERNYLLMYLREFASPDGILPADFDALVRDSFGDLLATLSQ